jgi:uncharacterized membrane protein YidH (DUF202 family)
LGCVVAGLAVSHVLAPEGQSEVGPKSAGVSLMVLGGLLALFSYGNWAASQRALRLRQPLPRSVLPVLVSIVAAVVAVVTVVCTPRPVHPGRAASPATTRGGGEPGQRAQRPGVAADRAVVVGCRRRGGPLRLRGRGHARPHPARNADVGGRRHLCAGGAERHRRQDRRIRADEQTPLPTGVIRLVWLVTLAVIAALVAVELGGVSP